MKINFYEEFPTKKNLQKLKLLKFKSRLFIASKSLQEFKSLEKQAKDINKNIRCAYWPIINNSYWISPFSNTNDLIELFRELEKGKDNLLIDLELPILNKKLFIKNIFSFRKNKQKIRSFLEKNKERITTAQLPFAESRIMRFLGIDYKIKTEKSFMWYSSMINSFLNNWIKKNLLRLKSEDRCSIGLGTIATGIFGNEPILTPEKLQADLKSVKKAGFDKVIIFRLGGLNKEYINVVERFAG